MNRRDFFAALGGLVTGTAVGYQRKRAYSFLGGCARWFNLETGEVVEPELMRLESTFNANPQADRFTLEDVYRAIEVLDRNKVRPKPDGTYDLFASRVRVHRNDNPPPGLARYSFRMLTPDFERMNREMIIEDLNRRLRET